MGNDIEKLGVIGEPIVKCFNLQIPPDTPIYIGCSRRPSLRLGDVGMSPHQNMHVTTRQVELIGLPLLYMPLFCRESPYVVFLCLSRSLFLFDVTAAYTANLRRFFSGA